MNPKVYEFIREVDKHFCNPKSAFSRYTSMPTIKTETENDEGHETRNDFFNSSTINSYIKSAFKQNPTQKLVQQPKLGLKIPILEHRKQIAE